MPDATSEAGKNLSLPACMNAMRTMNSTAPRTMGTQPKTADAHEPSSLAIAHSIAAVQQSLAIRDLSSARRHMRSLRASEQRSLEIQQLAAELSQRERSRDAALANARTCTMNKEPSCAIRNARRAVALDSRNPQAQGALRQALAVQIEANTEYFRQASALLVPATPAMTFDGRWSVSHKHASPDADRNDRSNFTLFGPRCADRLERSRRRALNALILAAGPYAEVNGARGRIDLP